MTTPLWWTNILPWKITIFNGKIHYKWPCSIAFCMFTRGYDNHRSFLSSTVSRLQSPARHRHRIHWLITNTRIGAWKAKKKLSMATALMLQCAFSSLFTPAGRQKSGTLPWSTRDKSGMLEPWSCGLQPCDPLKIKIRRGNWKPLHEIIWFWFPGIPWAPAWFASSVSDGDIGGFRPCQWAILSPSSRETPWINWTCTTPLCPPWVGCQVSAI